MLWPLQSQLRAVQCACSAHTLQKPCFLHLSSPRVLAAVQAMPPCRAVVKVPSISTLPVCLAICPTWDSCTATACMAGLRPAVPMGSTGTWLSHSKGEPRGKEGGMSPAAPWLSLPQTYTTAWAKGVCRRAVEILQDPEGFLSTSWAASWPARSVAAVPVRAQCLPWPD